MFPTIVQLVEANVKNTASALDKYVGKGYYAHFTEVNILHTRPMDALSVGHQPAGIFGHALDDTHEAMRAMRPARDFEEWEKTHSSTVGSAGEQGALFVLKPANPSTVLYVEDDKIIVDKGFGEAFITKLGYPADREYKFPNIVSAAGIIPEDDERFNYKISSFLRRLGVSALSEKGSYMTGGGDWYGDSEIIAFLDAKDAEVIEVIDMTGFGEDFKKHVNRLRKASGWDEI